MPKPHFNVILDLHRECGQEALFWKTLAWYLEYGYVTRTPDFFAYYEPATLDQQFFHQHPVPRDSAEGWFVCALAGDLQAFWESLPYPLPYVGFYRNKWRDPSETVRWFSYSRMNRLIIH